MRNTILFLWFSDWRHVQFGVWQSTHCSKTYDKNRWVKTCFQLQNRCFTHFTYFTMYNNIYITIYINLYIDSSFGTNGGLLIQRVFGSIAPRPQNVRRGCSWNDFYGSLLLFLTQECQGLVTSLHCV